MALVTRIREILTTVKKKSVKNSPSPTPPCSIIARSFVGCHLAVAVTAHMHHKIVFLWVQSPQKKMSSLAVRLIFFCFTRECWKYFTPLFFVCLQSKPVSRHRLRRSCFFLVERVSEMTLLYRPSVGCDRQFSHN